MNSLVHSDAKGVVIPTELIERLEAASVGSRALDDAILYAAGLHWDNKADSWVSADSRPLCLERPSQSLDAALALAERVLPGWDWKVGGLRPPIEGYDEREAPPHATLTRRGPLVANEGFAVADGATPALALCIAVLKATAALQAGQAGDFAKQNEPDTPPETGTGTGTEGGR